MKIIAVGVGNAFTDERYWQSNFMIEAKSGKRLLIDCGGDARHALREHGVHNGNIHENIDGVYVSHLHGDHIHGLEWIAFCTYFHPAAPRPKLYCVNKLMRPLWQSLKGGLESVQGKECTLADYFDTRPVKINGTFTWEWIEFTPVQTVHIMNGMEIINSYGLLIREIKKPTLESEEQEYGPTIFVTTDTQFCPEQIKDFYGMAEVILHDCETAPFESGVHAHFNKMKTLSEDVKAKMWLYHYNPEPEENGFDAVAEGFKGFLVKGQVLEF
jgi:ribonuclease BN (tRNA processing enzyme)